MHLEEMEDRSRRNNLRLRGIPEATGPEDLAEWVTAIFLSLLETPPPSLAIDRVHRTLGPKSADPDRPRDVLCRLHRYSQKENILCKSWERGNIEFDGVQIQILPDLSRATLQRRALLKPALEVARRHGCTYRLGYPLAVIFRKAQNSFTIENISRPTGVLHIPGGGTSSSSKLATEDSKTNRPLGPQQRQTLPASSRTETQRGTSSAFHHQVT